MHTTFMKGIIPRLDINVVAITGIRPTLEFYGSDCSVGKIVTGLFPVLQDHFPFCPKTLFCV